MQSQDGLGSMVQIKALGPQNEYTCAFPSTSPYIKMYRRHFGFARYSNLIEYRNYYPGDTIRLDIDPRTHADLMDEVLFAFQLQGIKKNQGGTPNDIHYVDTIGYALIKKVELKVGSLTVDTIDGDWLEVYDNLFLTDNRYTSLTNLIQRNRVMGLGSGEDFKSIVPLRFYFDQKPGSSFPFCALEHQRVQIIIHTRPMQEIVKSNNFDVSNLSSILNEYNLPILIKQVKLITNEYILDPHLRQFFQNNPLNYIVKTNRLAPAIQFDGSSDFSEDLKFRYYPDTNATVSLFTWGFRSKTALARNSLTGNDRFNFANVMTSTGIYLIDKWVDEEKIGDRKYWRYLQPLMSLPANPRLELYNWSLALKNNPLDDQEWGETDFSRIRGRQFFFEFTLTGTDYQPVLFMNVTNYLQIADGSIQGYFIY